MTDISGILKETMQEKNCSSFYAFLLVEGGRKDVSESVYEQNDKSNSNRHFMGTRNRRSKGLAIGS